MRGGSQSLPVVDELRTRQRSDALFLDLIGWSEDELGETIYTLTSASLGYVELSKLADALNEYTDAPHDVRSYVDALMKRRPTNDPRHCPPIAALST